jgi:hypothetical protein
MFEPFPSRPGPLLSGLAAFALATGLGAPLILGSGVALQFLHPVLGVLAACLVGVVLLVVAYRALRGDSAARFFVAFEVLVLAVLPSWGLGYSHFIGKASCEVSSCEAGETVMRVFAEPEVLGLVALHAVTALAYVISRRRPAALVPVAEALLHATLLAGILAQAAVAVHVARWLGVALLLAPVFLPCAAPLLTVVLYVRELHARLVRRGYEAAAPAATLPDGAPYREGPSQQHLPVPGEAGIHDLGLARALFLGPALLGVDAVLHALWRGHPGAVLDVFTHTCGHVLSQLPVVEVPEHCHYLCTVAARGHGWLVRPQRLGVRGGVTIVVNRQLALANAFEDLLHERWPRFGRVARRTYDRVGRPICRYLRRPLLADLVYLAMKPAEWIFYVTLLLLDRGEPEARIDRMYR